MMPAGRRYALLLAALWAALLAVAAAALLLAGLDMQEAQRRLFYDALAQQAGMLAALAAMLLLLAGALLKRVFDAWLTPLSRLREDAALLPSNPAHRCQAQGAEPVRALAREINLLAQQMAQLRQESQAQIDDALRSLAEERNRLAALMADLAVAVLVCNPEGRILLYNSRASALLDNGAGAAPGLGRSVFGVVDRGLVVHALEQLQHQLHMQAQDQGSALPLPLAPFVAALPDGRVMRMQMAPVTGEGRALGGFVLTADDISREAQLQDQLTMLADSLVQGARAGLASIRAAAETLAAYPDMDAARRTRFVAVIEQESQKLAAAVDRAAQRRDNEAARSWQREDMRGEDLLALLRRRFESRGLAVQAVDAPDPAPWFNVDSYALTEALARLGQRVAAECGAEGLGLRVGSEDRLAWLELAWRGSPPDAALADRLEQAPADGGETLASVVARHGGEAMLLSEAGVTRWRLLLPAVAAHPIGLLAPSRAPRPEFYDFDLLAQSGRNEALDATALSSLSYTVFDTETTGLDPAGGDDIIAIGALRIVNGRLLQQESFERLLRPRRPVSAAALAVHGISDALLRGQPGAAEVLPQFHRFIEDTVLVAHNAAFDLRFLRLRESEAGVAFDQPVLDTLLLSQALHPNQPEHSLEAIAQRLGVAVVGRHTALGDAIVTAEIFLRMLPLLAAAGIATLGAAREAAQRTRYARLRY